jgi:NodT family efflux transporter outer membrane factor (OMF) lipoprotein
VALARLLAQHGVVQAQLAQRERIRSITQRRVAAGLDTRVEQVQADAALPDLRVQREALDEQAVLLRRQLAVLSGQPPEALATLSPQLGALRSPALPSALGADLLGRRPDLVAARWRVESSLADVRAAEAAFYPSINLVAYAGLSALGLDRLFDLGSRQLGVQPALHLPLFDGGRLRAALQGRDAERDAAIAQYNATLLDAVREAGDALASEQSLQRQRAEQARALAAAEQAHAIAEKRYDAGLGNQLTVLATETAVLAQRRAAVDLQARQLDNRIALMKALGGGWTDDTALATR